MGLLEPENRQFGDEFFPSVPPVTVNGAFFTAPQVLALPGVVLINGREFNVANSNGSASSFQAAIKMRWPRCLAFLLQLQRPEILYFLY